MDSIWDFRVSRKMGGLEKSHPRCPSRLLSLHKVWCTLSGRGRDYTLRSRPSTALTWWQVKAAPQAGVAPWAGGRADTHTPKAKEPDKDPQLPEEKISLPLHGGDPRQCQWSRLLKKGFGCPKPKDENVPKWLCHIIGINRAGPDPKAVSSVDTHDHMKHIEHSALV